MDAITITLDGVEVSGYPGMTILDLARESGVDIPTLCHDPHLVPTGACRLCLVEEERSRALLASCVAPIAPGMVINTRSPRVIERRKTIVKLMLASHPDSCLVCDKGNRCQLRQIAAQMGIGLIELQRIPPYATIEEVNPFIERDITRCVLCGRCIRADQELVVEGAIDYVDRGALSRPATLGDTPLEKSECTFCGTCVAMCPTGALMEKERTYRGTATSTVETVCPFCGCGCSLSLEVKDNRLVRVRPGGESRVNRGTLCVRGCYGYDFVHSPDRLTTPLVRVNGELQTASWEQALDRVASELRQIREESGADSLAILGATKCTNEENYLLQRLARGVLGTNNIDNGSRLYSAASRVGLGWTIGVPGTTRSISELEQCRVIMVAGANPAASAPAVGYAIKRAVKYGDARLILVDPRQTRLAPLAHLWLRPRPGTDVALINGMARVVVDEGLFDGESVARRTDNFTELNSSLRRYTPEYVEQVTGVPGEQVVEAARLFARAGRAAVVYGNGITQQSSGVDNVMALANLAMLTQNVGHQKGGIFALQRDSNAQGACDMGSLPDFLPGYQSLDDAGARKAFEKRWGVSLPAAEGLTALQMIDGVRAGRVRGMLVVGENPVAGFPGTSGVRDALSSLKFLAVTELFLTETAKLATVVLPAASFAEKDGTTTNFEGRVRHIRKAVEPVGKPDWQIVLELAERLGHPMPYAGPGEVMNEIEDLVPVYQRLAYTGLETEDRDWADLESGRLGARRRYRGRFPSGFGRFSPVEYQPLAPPGDGYPLTLITGTVLPHFGGGSRSLRASRLRKSAPRGWVEVGDADAARLGLNDGDTVRVVSPAGVVTAAVRMTDTLPAGTLFMPISFPDCPVNSLFDMAIDERAKTAPLKHCAVRVERI